MNRESRGQKIRDLAIAIMEHKSLYYSGTPRISDQEYDKLEDALRSLAPEHPALHEVGTEPKANSSKVQHDEPMLSLQKTYVLKDLISWQDNQPILGTWKIDGNSLSLIYEKGTFQQAKTRGNGRVGEEVTSKAHWVGDIVPTLNTESHCEVRGELYCSLSSFATLANKMESLGLERPSNPRNIVAGLLGRKTHIDLARYFGFFAFDVLSSDSRLQFKTEVDKLVWLQSQGFSTPKASRLRSEDEIKQFLDVVKADMDDGEVGIDGAVFTLDNNYLHKEMGSTSHHPRYKMSFKWQGQTATSVVKSITWATSRLGVVTPVAVIQPVQLSGANITNITLHNAEHVIAYNLKAGDQIELVRSGEVIPKFLSVKEAAQGKYELPKNCPSCQSDLEFDSIRLRCVNEVSCPAQQMGFILNWIRSAEIDDLSEKRLQAMLDLGMVADPADLYKLSEEDFLSLPLTKEKMAQKLFTNIQNSKKLPLPRFLNGLGIEGTGLTSWEKILEELPSLSELRAAKAEQIAAIDGFAEKSAHQIVKGLKLRSDIIDKLNQVGVTPKAEKKKPSSNQLNGQTFVITGQLSRPRSQIESQIKELGGKTSSSVSKKTTALVCNDTESTSSKMKKAQSLDIPIWTEDQLMAYMEESL